MNAAIATADEFLAEAKRGIDTGTLTTAEIEEYLAAAKAVISKARLNSRVEPLAAAAREAMRALDHLENIRRLVAYGVAQGRLAEESMEFCRLMATRPPLDTAKGIRGFTPSFEWLKANRPALSRLLQNINPTEQ